MEHIIDFQENPEEINDGKDTAPSKRLKSLIPRYNKVVDGNNIISSNGLDLVLNKCTRFKGWVEKILGRFDVY